MDGADAFASPADPWSLVRGYFSTATLFLLLNVVIGTIALTSRSHRRDDDDHQHHCHHDQQPYAPPPPAAPLARTSSFMERLRSIGLYRFRSGDFPPEYNHHHSISATPDDVHQLQYARSRSEPAARPPPPPVRKQTDKKEEAATRRAAVKKPTSEVKKMERAPPRAPTARAVAAREVADDATAVSVDAQADDFINRFRQQLQLQRLNSLLNYKEMLNRGL